MKLTKSEANPILSPLPGSHWEGLVTTNPGAWYEDGTFYLLYRAAGDDEHADRIFQPAQQSDCFFRAGSLPSREAGNIFHHEPGGESW